MKNLIIILIVIGSGFSIVSKPTEEALEKQIYSQILSDVKSTKTDDSDGILNNIVNFSCNLFPDKCAEQIYNTKVTIKMKDNILYKMADVKIDDEYLTCIGIFNTWKC